MGNNIKGWIKQLRKGDQSVFLPFYQQTAPGLMRFLLWKTSGDRPLAEDVLQETYVKFLLNLDRLESLEPASVQAYLLRIVRNCLVDKTGRTPQFARPHVSLDSVGELPGPGDTPAQERAVEVRELAIAMESLGERESEILWLRDGLGLTHREVADRTGLTEQASRQAYVRAKRSLLSELGAGLTGGTNAVT